VNRRVIQEKQDTFIPAYLAVINALHMENRINDNK